MRVILRRVSRLEKDVPEAEKERAWKEIEALGQKIRHRGRQRR
jgi:hypothetical protein